MEGSVLEDEDGVVLRMSAMVETRWCSGVCGDGYKPVWEVMEWSVLVDEDGVDGVYGSNVEVIFDPFWLRLCENTIWREKEMSKIINVLPASHATANGVKKSPK